MRPAILLAAVLSLTQAPVFADEAAPAATPIPAELRGTWRVSGVLVDTGTLARLRIEYNDPSYLDSILLIAPDALLGAIESWGVVCMDPTVTVKPTTAGALIKDTMAAAPTTRTRPRRSCPSFPR